MSSGMNEEQEKEFIENLKEGQCKDDECGKLSTMDSSFCMKHQDKEGKGEAA